MEGPDSAELFNEKTNKCYKDSGILPRIAIYIFKEIERLHQKLGIETYIEVSALEIYCETIRDMLNESSDKYVEIKGTGKTMICHGQTWVQVTSPSDFLD